MKHSWWSIICNSPLCWCCMCPRVHSGPYLSEVMVKINKTSRRRGGDLCDSWCVEQALSCSKVLEDGITMKVHLQFVFALLTEDFKCLWDISKRTFFPCWAWGQLVLFNTWSFSTSLRSFFFGGKKGDQLNFFTVYLCEGTSEITPDWLFSYFSCCEEESSRHYSWL